MSAVAESWPMQTGVLGSKSGGSEGSDGERWGFGGGGEGEDVRSMISGSAGREGRKGLGEGSCSCCWGTVLGCEHPGWLLLGE